MAARREWKMAPGKTVNLSKSLAADLGTDELLSGTPTVTVFLKTSVAPLTFTDVTTSYGFTVASEAVNVAAITTDDGQTVAIGEAVTFTLTSTETPGEYEVRVECDGDAGSRPVSIVTLTVAGPGTP